MNELTIQQNNPLTDQLTKAGDKSTRSRLDKFINWQKANNQAWYEPDLAGWLLSLQKQGKSPATQSSYLSTVRGAYRRILKSNGVRRLLYAYTDPQLDISDRKAYVDELLEQLENYIHPDNAPIEEIEKQDRADSEFIRLSTTQAKRLIEAPDTTTLEGLRDSAMLALMLCTGVREFELVNLTVTDLYQTYGGVPALRVIEGKGDKQRLVPYGELSWCLVIVNRYLSQAGIADGYLFSGGFRGKRAIKLNVRSVQRVVAKYPVVIDGAPTVITPHSLRRSYARILYDSGMEIEAIRQNLGHARMETTLGYIGALGAEKRQPKNAFQPDMSRWQ